MNYCVYMLESECHPTMVTMFSGVKLPLAQVMVAMAMEYTTNVINHVLGLGNHLDYGQYFTRQYVLHQMALAW